MSWYGLGSIACSGTTVTGTGTKWKDNKLGIGAGQALLIPGSSTVKIYEIKSVDSDTKITLVSTPGTIAAGQAYAIMSFYTDSVPDFARRLSAQLSYYQSQMDGWQKILTGTGDITLTAPDNTTVVIPAMSWISDSKTWFDTNKELIENAGAGVARDQAVAANTAAQAAKTTTVNSAATASTAATTATGAASTTTKAKNDAVAAKAAAEAAAASVNLGPIGIGLPTQTDIANFDWQNFVFTSGANYVTSYSTWINPPDGVTYNAGTRVSIRVAYILTGSYRVGLELTPDTGSSTNFKVYKLLCVGAAGSRVFTVREEWNSANPIPISGGGTGATTAAGALVNLGLGEGSLIPIGVPLPYPLATAPTGYLKCNGSSFSTTTYPQLAVAYPSGVLPDLRGEFIRGWDDGRRVDSGRVVLTGQSQSVQKHTHGLAMAYSSESGYKDRLGAGPNTDMIPIKDMTNVTTFTGSGEYYLKANDSTGVETRPRNVAFNYIVRAV